jgi:hypothetical protein
MLTFVDYMATQLIILPAINLMACGPEKVFEQSGPLITTAIDSLMRRAVESGDLRDDVSGMDMLRALAGLWAVAPTEDWPVSARKMVEILLLGARRVYQIRTEENPGNQDKEIRTDVSNTGRNDQSRSMPEE